MQLVKGLAVTVGLVYILSAFLVLEGELDFLKFNVFVVVEGDCYRCKCVLLAIQFLLLEINFGRDECC